MYLRAAYYINEINDLILNVLEDGDRLEKFYIENSTFEINFADDFISFENIKPILKVAWNITSRGTPTKAPLKISKFLLSKYFSKNYISLVDTEPEIFFNLNLDKEAANSLRENLDKLFLSDEADVIEGGTFVYNIWKLFRDLEKISYLHKAILIVLMKNPAITNFRAIGIDQEVSKIAIESLNDLFSTLNALTDDKEDKLPILNLVNDKQAKNVFSIYFDEPNIENQKYSLTIRKVYKEELNVFDNVLTDRKIRYKNLGQVKEFEENGQYKQKFEYYSEELKEALVYFLQNIFRKSTFRPGQEEIINRVLSGDDLIALLPTGGGKSLTYQLSALLQPGVTIVVDPINSLMKDQYDKLIEFGILKVDYINSLRKQENADENEKALERLTSGETQILFVAPERFQMPKYRKAFEKCYEKEIYFTFAVIDEAHCVSEWGHDFRPVYLNLAENIKRFCKPKGDERLTFLALTATASFDVLSDIQRELHLTDNAVVRLPAEAINRPELHFKIEKIKSGFCDKLYDHKHKECSDEGIIYKEACYEDFKLIYTVDEQLIKTKEVPYRFREKKLGEEKYSKLYSLLRQIPNEIKKFYEKEEQDINEEEIYRQNDNGEYKHGGIIFCPTKSEKLPNGVLFLKNCIQQKLQNQDYRHICLSYNHLNFNLTTFLSSVDSTLVPNREIDIEADNSLENQEKFIKNKANLMIATKAFGMGIDKPNIRFTIHYLFPNSVESFYQEAGRAGRDGKPAISYILFHPLDIETNLDFFRNSLKGIEREKHIIDEFFEEVHYEDQFFINILKNKIQNKYPEVKAAYLRNRRYLDLYGTYQDRWEDRIRICRIDLRYSDYRYYEDAIRNFDRDKAIEIIEYTQEVLKEIEEKEGASLIEYLQKISVPGIETLMEERKQDKYELMIGFTNGLFKDLLNQIHEYLKNEYNISYAKEVNELFTENVIMSAYNFSDEPQKFKENLEYYFKEHQRQKFGSVNYNIIFGENLNKYIDNYFYKFRNLLDTQRVIYRLSVSGIIDDYTINYADKYFIIRFRRKSKEEYRENLRKYLRRYLSISETNKLLDRLENNDGESILKKVINIVIEFYDKVITKKRLRAICYMNDLCNSYKEEKEFKERIVTYFTSKYARIDYLPADLENENISEIDLIKKYIDFIYNPPDGLGGQVDNAKHLRGACESIRISAKEDRPSLDLLLAFSIFALQLHESLTETKIKSDPKIMMAIDLYRKGFAKLKETEKNWNTLLELLNFYNKKILDFNVNIKGILNNLTAEILLDRTNKELKKVLHKIYQK